jgi:hypothetical protein
MHAYLPEIAAWRKHRLFGIALKLATVTRFPILAIIQYLANMPVSWYLTKKANKPKMAI